MKRKLGDKYLVVTTGALSRENSMFIELNETSSDIWDWIEKGCNKSEIADRLCEKYNVGREKAEQDTERLIASMQQAGIFEE